MSPYLYLWGGRGIKEFPSTAGESGGGNYLFIRDEELGSGCSGWEGSGDPHRCLWALLFYGTPLASEFRSTIVSRPFIGLLAKYQRLSKTRREIRP